ncbi:cyclase [Mycobacterium saskatchewanense]|uniref:Cyclase n=1 Tax=Mycobacterium saskatchewanense TaxID=220927 RepID=A0A1X2BKN7_9MYCO|nr:cyclase family protein [Mycobacterium saskatchewanense]ORW64172.1 hypothetical protein AWC23_26400 [Mycobacterium saskatchewanense]BBX62123.1 cyclase [Mycobacterium saskatchewanense]
MTVITRAELIAEGQRRALMESRVPTPPASTPLLGGALLDRPHKIVDLTRPLYEGMPVWFGHQKTFTPVNQDHDRFKELHQTEIGFYARNLIISEHAGTHSDATIEYDPAGMPIDQLPLEMYWGSAVCLDMSEAEFIDPDPDCRGWATEDVVRRAEAKLGAAGEAIRPGDIVLAWFDYGDRHFPTPQYIHHNPGFSWDGLEYLAKKGVVNIGTDCSAIDHSADSRFSGHMVCKKYGLVNTEHLANLGQLVNTRFMFYGLPLNIIGGTGSPIRAVAVLP